MKFLTTSPTNSITPMALAAAYGAAYGAAFSTAIVLWRKRCIVTGHGT